MNRSGQIDALMREGNLSEVWLPAMGTKTVALVLESHASSLPAAKRSLVTSSVKRVVTSAWEIDGYGDLGQPHQNRRGVSAHHDGSGRPEGGI